MQKLKICLRHSIKLKSNEDEVISTNHLREGVNISNVNNIFSMLMTPKLGKNRQFKKGRCQ